jgi:hypothetical protein
MLEESCRFTLRTRRQSRSKRILLNITAILIFVGISLFTIASAEAKPAANLDQCANGPNGTVFCNDSLNAGWQNGNLNANQARYFEGDSVPYRSRISGLTVGNTYTVTIQWDTTKQSKHALDYLTSVDRTVPVNACLGVAGVPAGACSSPSFAGIPVDPLVQNSGVTQIPGNFTIL